MTITKEPFVRYKTDEEKAEEKRKLLNISFNDEEWEELQGLVKDLDIKDKHGAEAKAVKIAIGTAKNVIHLFSSPTYALTFYKRNRGGNNYHD